jgi:riboflavin kinase/FMN adenylyltransferase
VKIFRGIDEVGDALRGASVALGNFDGVHLGHQALFATAQQHALRRKAPTAALTFDPHPVKLLAPEVAPPQLSPLSVKLELMDKLGLDAVVVQPFTRVFADQEPMAFTQALMDVLGVGEVVVGFDFTYGKGRKGTIDTLRQAGEARGVAISIVPKVTVDGLPASSTKVRELILEGRVEPASRLLDRHYSLAGKVVRGVGRGRTIGFPTANLSTDFELIPGSGVYAVVVELKAPSASTPTFWAGAVNIGRKPTFSAGTEASTVEVHLIDYSGDLYEQQIEVFFLERLRPEQRFSGVDALREQIGKDVLKAKELVSDARPMPLDPQFVVK